MFPALGEVGLCVTVRELFAFWCQKMWTSTLDFWQKRGDARSDFPLGQRCLIKQKSDFLFFCFFYQYEECVEHFLLSTLRPLKSSACRGCSQSVVSTGVLGWEENDLNLFNLFGAQLWSHFGCRQWNLETSAWDYVVISMSNHSEKVGWQWLCCSCWWEPSVDLFH